MNVKRFVGRTSHEALGRLKAALGPDAVVLSTRPCAEGVEILAMGPEAITRLPSEVAQDVEGDAQTLSMSTLSFQDYVRERMLKRREAARKAAQQVQEARAMQGPQGDVRRQARDLHERARAQADVLGAGRAPSSDFGGQAQG